MNEKEMDKVQKELRKVANELIQSIKEYINQCVLFCDSKRLLNLSRIIDIQIAYEVINGIREKGFSKELTELCEKIGRTPK